MIALKTSVSRHISLKRCWEMGPFNHPIGLIKRSLLKKTDYVILFKEQLKNIGDLTDNRPRKVLIVKQKHSMKFLPNVLHLFLECGKKWNEKVVENLGNTGDASPLTIEHWEIINY